MGGVKVWMSALFIDLKYLNSWLKKLLLGLILKQGTALDIRINIRISCLFNSNVDLN